MKYTGTPIIENGATYGTENTPWGYWDTKEGLEKWINTIQKSDLSFNSKVKQESLKKLKLKLIKVKIFNFINRFSFSYDISKFRFKIVESKSLDHLVVFKYSANGGITWRTIHHYNNSHKWVELTDYLYGNYGFDTKKEQFSSYKKIINYEKNEKKKHIRLKKEQKESKIKQKIEQKRLIKERKIENNKFQDKLEKIKIETLKRANR